MAVGVKGDLDLGVVEVVTKQGSCYRYPDMDKNALQKVLPKGENRIRESMPTLSMCNASFVVLSIPFRVIDKITVDGEEWWASPA